MPLTAFTVTAEARALNLEFTFETCPTHSFAMESPDAPQWNALIYEAGSKPHSWDVMDESTLWDAIIYCIRRRVEYELAMMTSDRVFRL